MMNFNNKIYTDSVFFDIYLIGYTGEGESILFTLTCDDEIFYSGVIDSYSRKENNETINLMKKLGINKLDFLCWSHPHDDHSKGFNEILKKYVKKQTKLVYPSELIDVENSCATPLTNSIKNLIIEKVNLREDNQLKPSIVPIKTASIISRKRISFFKKGTYKFEVDALTPQGSILESYSLVDNVSHINELSVSILVKIGKVSAYFASDIQKRTINLIDPDFLLDPIDYLKVAHHGSIHSKDLFNFPAFNSGFPQKKVASTTQYSKSNLPKKEIMNMLESRFENIYTTYGDLNNNGIGIVHTRFDIVNEEVVTHVLKDAKQYSGS